MFYMPFDSPHQDESNGISFIRKISLTNKLSAKFFQIRILPIKLPRFLCVYMYRQKI
jgi:hypothetical protein